MSSDRDDLLAKTFASELDSLQSLSNGPETRRRVLRLRFIWGLGLLGSLALVGVGTVLAISSLSGTSEALQPAAAPEPTATYGPGQPAQDGSAEFTVSAGYCGTQEFREVGSARFCAIFVRVKNLSQETLNVDAQWQSLRLGKREMHAINDKVERFDENYFSRNAFNTAIDPEVTLPSVLFFAPIADGYPDSLVLRGADRSQGVLIDFEDCFFQESSDRPECEYGTTALISFKVASR